MQPATQLPYEQKYSMSWREFISSVLLSFLGTQLVTVFLVIPLSIYTDSLTNKKKLPCLKSMENTASIALQLAMVLFFIFKFEPAERLLLKSLNFKAIKEW